MMDGATLQRLASDPAEFRKVLTIPAVHGPRLFVDVMADFQARDFAALDPALLALKAGTQPPIGRYWWERTKGASKDSDLAVCLLWLLAFTPRPLTCQVGAADESQADELRKAAKSILRLNPWLANLLTIQALSIINPRTDSRCEIIPADVAGSHGARPDVLVLNELSHVGKREFAENLLDNASKVPHGLVCIATNAGFIPSWQYDFREQVRQSPRWYFSAYQQPAPWLDAAELADARKRSSSNRYARLWEGQWVSSVGNGIPPEQIDAAIKPGLKPTRSARHGWRYVCGLDLATARDMSAAVVVGRQVGATFLSSKPAKAPVVNRALAVARDLGMVPEPEPEETICRVRATGKLRVCYVRTWQAPKGAKQKLSHIETALKELHERFDFEAVAFDPYEMALLAERLTDAGLPMQPMTFSAANLVSMASAVVEEFANNNVQIYDCDAHAKQLISDLRRMQLVEMSYGTKLAAKRSGGNHVDAGTAFAIATLASRDFMDATEDLVAGGGPLIW